LLFLLSFLVISCPNILSNDDSGTNTDTQVTDGSNPTDPDDPADPADPELTAPEAPVVSGPAGTVTTTRPTWTWTGEAEDLLYQYQLDSTAGTWTNIADTSYTPGYDLTEGPHQL